MSDVYFKRINSEELNDRRGTILSLIDKSDLSSHIKRNDFVGIKIHFGEKGNKSFINPQLLRSLVQYLRGQKTKPFFFDTNTLYRGKRTNAVDHFSIAENHGFLSLGIPVFIADGIKGNDYVPVEINKKHYKKCFIASMFEDIDFILSVSHFTAHQLSGFGASIKNLGMGLASRRGKLEQHCEISPKINEKLCINCGICAEICPASCIQRGENSFVINSDKCIGCAQCISVCPRTAVKISWSTEHNLIQERIAEYAYAATRGKRGAYFNFCIYITKDCDCMNKEEQGFVQDLGILFSYDPVAVDQASIDMIINNQGYDFLNRLHPEIDYNAQLRHAQEIGLGQREYTIIEV
jgi:hypothetical protein